jgi:hypothetical protein
MFPAYHDGMEVQDDELLDIDQFGVPILWQKQFLIQNWDPILSQHSKQNFRDFCEQLEIAESTSLDTFQVKYNDSRGKPGLISDPRNYGGSST